MAPVSPIPASKIQSTPGAFPQEPSHPSIISTQQSLSQAVHSRRAEYTRTHKVRVKVGTWNVAALTGTEKDIGGWFVQGKGVSDALSGLSVKDEDSPSKNSAGLPIKLGHLESIPSQEARRTKKQSTIPKNDEGALPGGDDIGIYVLGLQEIVDISSATEALRPFNDPHPARKWKRAIAEALPDGYQRIAEQQLIGLLLLVYASPSIAPTITSVSTTSVGTGLMGYMGNKGAVTARIILGETTRLVFINCHLAAGHEKGSVERRNWDASQVLSRTKFDVVSNGEAVEEIGDMIGDEDFAFWFGDLNYRLDDLPGDDVRRLLLLHTRNEYDTRQASSIKIDDELGSISPRSSSKDFTSLSNNDSSQREKVPNEEGTDPASDPTSLQTTLSSLLPHDQLHKQMRSRKAFHDGWREGCIEFLPTYKYDVGSVGMFDSSEKKRGPSWCDRILYRTRKDRLEYEETVKEEAEAKRRDDQMKARGLDKPVDDDVLFDYDPETDGVNEGEDEYEEDRDADSDVVFTRAGFRDRLQLNYYTSHQRVLSSDHKPLDAVFTLDYDAVDPELKAHVHQEVARELDKAENEGRPVVTIVIDHHHRRDEDKSPEEGINFGHVRYDVEKVRSITVANTGRVPATFGFVDRPVHQGKPTGVSPPYLAIRFDRPSDNHNPNPNALREYTLEPGEATNIDFILRISDMEEVRSLNETSSDIEDVLVLRIHGGRDHFLPVKAKWLESTFGRSLDKLVRIPEGGVRRLQHQRPDGSGDHGDDDHAVKWSAPREVFRLTEALEELVERALAEWDMRGEGGDPPWKVDGWPFAKESWTSLGRIKVQKVKFMAREALDTDQAFAFSGEAEITAVQKVEVLADVLLDFLASLKDGVVTEERWNELEKGILEMERVKKVALVGEEKRSWILEVLSSSPSPAHSITFTFLTFMLARVANELAPLPSVPATPLTPVTPKSPKSPDRSSSASSRRGKEPLLPLLKRRRIHGIFADIFARVMIRASVVPGPGLGLGKGKEGKASQERRREIVEVFLRSRWEEEMEGEE